MILENTFTSILDMAGILLPFLRYFIGGSSSKGLKVLNHFVRSPWNTIDIVGQVSSAEMTPLKACYLGFGEILIIFQKYI